MFETWVVEVTETFETSRIMEWMYYRFSLIPKWVEQKWETFQDKQVFSQNLQFNYRNNNNILQFFDINVSVPYELERLKQLDNQNNMTIRIQSFSL